MEKEYLIMACEMYGVKTIKELPVGMYNQLSKVNELCKKANGTLTSRQVIASIVEQYTKI